MARTTIYVDTEGMGETCLEVYSSQFEDEGVEYLGNLSGTGIVVVDDEDAPEFASTINRMPGCHVRQQESH